MPWVWADDETDERAAKTGRLTFMEAARRLGYRSATPVKDRIMQGILQKTEFAGRTYVDEASVDRLLAQDGYPSETWQKIEELEATGRSQEAMDLRMQLQRSANAAWEARFGTFTKEEAPRSAADLPDPGTSFVARVIGSWKGAK